jgi:hypothetical protein
MVKYEAPDIAGDVKLSYDVKDFSDNLIPSLPINISVRSKERFEKIQIPGLPINVNSHPGDGDYGTPNFILRLKNMVELYKEYAYYLDIPEDKIVELSSQSASLSWGGLFDINKDWKPPHCGHRDGKTIDLSMSGLTKNYTEDSNDGLTSLQWAIEDSLLGFPVLEESDVIFDNHWHVESID